MFSRSEHTEDVMDPMAEPSGERSPMMMAAVAGVLALAGALLLVWFLSSNGSGDTAAGGADGTAQVVDGQQATRPVLVVTQTIPRGTSVRELVDAPTVYLAAQEVPEAFVAATAITSVAELQELDGWVLSSDALEGEQLLRGRFRDPADFDATNETFLEAETGIEAPAGHHAVTFELPTTRAMGGNIRAGEQVTIVGNFRIAVPDASIAEVSVVVLNSAELLNIESALEVSGEISQDINQLGLAARGNLVVTAAVKPEELTDLTYAIEFGQLWLATAVAGLDNEDGPRAVTTIEQQLGDDGVWLEVPEDGNIVDLIQFFEREDESSVQGESIELELPDETDSTDGSDDLTFEETSAEDGAEDPEDS